MGLRDVGVASLEVEENLILLIEEVNEIQIREKYYLALEYFNSKQEIDKMVKLLDDQAYKTWVKDYNIKGIT